MGSDDDMDRWHEVEYGWVPIDEIEVPKGMEEPPDWEVRYFVNTLERNDYHTKTFVCNEDGQLLNQLGRFRAAQQVPLVTALPVATVSDAFAERHPELYHPDSS